MKSIALFFSLLLLCIVPLQVQAESTPVLMPLWEQTLGESRMDIAFDVIPTADENFVLVGLSEREHGDTDARVIKFDTEGQRLWDRRLGGSKDDFFRSAITTTDGSLLLTGGTESSRAGLRDLWVCKMDLAGNKLWDRIYGGSGADSAKDLLQMPDGGYLVVGYATPSATNVEDAWIVKLDAEGALVWERTFGGSGVDIANATALAADGGILVAGSTAEPETGREDAWLVKLDTEGNPQWVQTYEEEGNTEPLSVLATTDGGCLLVGHSVATATRDSDAWLVKVDADGNQSWRRTFGGAQSDSAFDALRTSDGSLMVVGYTNSKGAGGSDGWVLHLTSEGKLAQEEYFGGEADDNIFAIAPAGEHRYILTGGTYSKGAGDNDIWLLKLNDNTEN